MTSALSAASGVSVSAWTSSWTVGVLMRLVPLSWIDAQSLTRIARQVTHQTGTTAGVLTP